MRIHNLALREFRCFREADIDLSADVVAIYGRNGIGKTSVFDAIEFALFGSVERLEEFGDGVDYISRIGASGPSLVRLILSEDSGIREVETSWERDTRSARARSGNKAWPSHRELLYDLLVDEDSLGSRHEVATVRELFRATLMLSQVSIRDFVNSDAEKRARILARLAGLAHIQRSKDKAESVAAFATKQAELIADQLTVDTTLERKLIAQCFEAEARVAARRERLRGARPSSEDFSQAVSAAGMESSNLSPGDMLTRASDMRIRSEEQLKELDGQLQRLLILQSTEGSHSGRAARLLEIERESVALRIQARELSDRTESGTKAKRVIEISLMDARGRSEELARRLDQLLNARTAAHETARLRARLQTLDLRTSEAELRTAEAQRSDAVRARAAALATKSAANLRASKLRAKIEALARLQEETAEYERLGEELAGYRDELESANVNVRSGEAAITSEQRALHEARVRLQAAQELASRLSGAMHERASLLSRVRALATNEHCPLCGAHHDSAAALAQAMENRLRSVPEATQKAIEAEEAARNTVAHLERRVSVLTAELRSLRTERDRLNIRIHEVRRRQRATEEEAEALGLAVAADDLHIYRDAAVRELRAEEEKAQEQDTAATQAAGRARAAEEAIAAARKRLEELTTTREQVAKLLGASEGRLGELGYTSSNIPTDEQFSDAIRQLNGEIFSTGNERVRCERELVSATAAAETIAAERAQLGAAQEVLESERGHLAGLNEVARRRWREVGGVGEPSDDDISEMIRKAKLRIENVVRLRDMATQVELSSEVQVLEASAASLQREYRESVQRVQGLRERLTATRTAEATAKSWVRPLAENLRTAVARTVAAHQLEIERHFRAMIPSPHLFDGIGMHHEAERLEIGLRYRGQDSESGEPRVFLSNAQLNVLALAMFMSLGARQHWSRLRVLLMDDPIQHLDDLDAVAFLDTLRAVALGRFGGRRQIIVSTCDKTMYRLMIQKFQLIEKSGARFTAISLVEGGLSGPTVEYDFGRPGVSRSQTA
jgi:exonuclease SbcC